MNLVGYAAQQHSGIFRKRGDRGKQKTFDETAEQRLI